MKLFSIKTTAKAIKDKVYLGKVDLTSKKDLVKLFRELYGYKGEVTSDTARNRSTEE